MSQNKESTMSDKKDQKNEGQLVVDLDALREAEAFLGELPSGLAGGGSGGGGAGGSGGSGGGGGSEGAGGTGSWY